MKCSQCKKGLELGVDVITVEECVVGPRDIIPLGKKECFCSEKCLLEFYDLSGLTESPRRIP